MIKNNLSTLIGNRRTNMSELSRITGLSKSTIFNLYHNKANQINFKTMNLLCVALNCNTQEFFEFIPENQVKYTSHSELVSGSS